MKKINQNFLKLDNFCDSPILNIYLTNAKTTKKKHFLLYMDQSTEAEKQSLGMGIEGGAV